MQLEVAGKNFAFSDTQGVGFSIVLTCHLPARHTAHCPHLQVLLQLAPAPVAAQPLPHHCQPVLAALPLLLLAAPAEPHQTAAAVAAVAAAAVVPGQKLRVRVRPAAVLRQAPAPLLLLPPLPLPLLLLLLVVRQRVVDPVEGVLGVLLPRVWVLVVLRGAQARAPLYAGAVRRPHSHSL